MKKEGVPAPNPPPNQQHQQQIQVQQQQIIHLNWSNSKPEFSGKPDKDAEMHLLLYNILLPINHYTGNSTTKHHGESMSDNRDLTETFHQKVSSLPVSIASDSRYFQSS